MKNYITQAPILVLLLSLFMFSNCKKEEKEEALQALIQASSSTGTPLDTIVFDGSASKAPSGSNFIYSVKSGQQQGADYEMFNNGDGKIISIYFKKAGTYNIELRIEHNGSFSIANSNVVISGAKKIAGNISSPTSLINLGDLSDYFISDIIEVSSILTIESDVKIDFGQNAGFIIKEGGEIRTNGSVGVSLNYAGTEENEGWRGIYVENGKLNVQNSLSIFKAGYGNWPNGKSGSIVIDEAGRVNLENQLFINNSGSYDIILLTENAKVDKNNSSADIILSGSKEIAISGFAKHINLVTGQDVLFELRGGEVNIASWGHNYSIFGNKLLISDDVTIKNATEFRFSNVYVAQGKSILFDNGIPNIMSSSSYTEYSGYKGAEWKGIYFKGSTDPGQMRVKILNAGWRESGSSEISAAITVMTGTLFITNSHIENPYGYGIYCPTSISNLQNSTFTNCLKAGIALNYRNAHGIKTDNTFNLTANVPGVELIEGNGEANFSFFTFPKLSNSFYSINTIDMYLNSSATIHPGCRFKVHEGVNIFVDNTFTADGTNTDSIIFEGILNNNGYWNGISVNTGSGHFKMSYCRISDAGKGFLKSSRFSSSFATQKANIAFFITNPMSVNTYFKDSHVSNSAGYGVYIDNIIASLDATYLNNNNVGFSNNTIGDVFKN